MERLKNINRGTSFNQSLGTLKTFSSNKNGLQLQSEDELIDIEIYSPSIVRIRIRKRENEVKDFSYLVLVVF
jgi:hypothetical protein